MEESNLEDNKEESPMELDRHDGAKRMKTDFDTEESSTSSSNSGNNVTPNNCFDQSASTSTDSGLQTTNNDYNNTDNENVEDSSSFWASNLDWLDERLLTFADDESLNRIRPEELFNRRPQESELWSDNSLSHANPTNCVEQNNENQDIPLNGIEEGPNGRSNINELSCDSDVFSSRHSSSGNTVLQSTDTESDEEAQTDEVLKKEKPKHTWFLVPEVIKRQYGYNSRQANPVKFQKQCYGSLMPVEKLELMYKLEEHEGCVNSLNFSPDGRWLASGSDDLKVVIWDWAVGKSQMKINTRHKKNIFQTRFLNLKGPDLHLATCGKDGQVWYQQVSNDGPREIQKLGQHRGPCHKLTVLEDQPHVLLSAGEDGIVFNHDIRRPKADRIVHVKDDCAREVALYSIHSHPLKSEEFCIAGRENYVRVYDQRMASVPLAKYCPYSSSDPKYTRGLHITCAVYNHDGSEILASYNDDDIYIFDNDDITGQYAHRYSGHRNGATIKSVAFFGPRSEFVMSGSDCAHIFFWEKKTEKIVQFLLADDNGVVNCLEPHPGLPFLATSGLDWDVKLWVPSCEEQPSMKDLADTVKENKRNGWGAYDPTSESQVLWMLWRRLRASSAARQRQNAGNEDGGFSFLTLDSSEDSSSDSWTTHSGEEDDLDVGPGGCNTS